MEIEEKKALMEGMSDFLKGATIGQLNMFVESGAKMVYQEITQARPAEQKKMTHEDLEKAVLAVQEYMWGSSAYAVLFCECRDNRGYPDNKSQFEREVNTIDQKYGLSWSCRNGTLSDAFCDNPYFNYNVDKWEEKGAKQRSLILLKKFQAELP